MSHEAVYIRVLCPRDKKDLARHRSHACAPSAPEVGRINLVGQHIQPSSWGWSVLVDRPEDLDDRRAPGALAGVA